MAADNQITIHVKNMAGELTTLRVSTDTHVNDVAQHLISMDPAVYPLHRTRVFRSPSEDEKQDTLQEDDVLCVFVQDIIHECVFTEDQKPYTVFLLPPIDHRTYYLYAVPTDVVHAVYELDFALSTTLLTDIHSLQHLNMMIREKNPIIYGVMGQMHHYLYSLLNEHMRIVAPTIIQSIYDILHPYYEELRNRNGIRYIIHISPREIIQCECGSTIRRNGIYQHSKTIKHRNYIASQENKETHPPLHPTDTITCQCGSVIKHTSIRSHLQTNKHRNYLRSLQ